MTGIRSHNKAAGAPLPLSTLACEMTEMLAGFRAYVRFESRDPTENRHRFYDLHWQPTPFGDGALVRTWGAGVNWVPRVLPSIPTARALQPRCARLCAGVLRTAIASLIGSKSAFQNRA